MAITRKIKGIYIPVKLDSTQLAKDTLRAKQIVTESAKSMSDALNNAFTPGQIKGNINALIANLGTLARSQGLVKESFQSIGVALGDLQRLTGTTGGEFIRLQQRMMETQAAKAQENALRSVSTAIGATRQEVQELGTQFGLSVAQIDKVTLALHGEEKVVQSLAQRIRELNTAKPIVNYTTMASSASTGLNTQAQAATQAFSKDLVALSGSAEIARRSVDLLELDMVALSRTTGLTAAQITMLKSRFAATAGEKSQEQALQNIARSAGLAEKEMRALGRQMGVSQASIDKVATSMNTLGKSTEFSMSKFKDMIITVGIYTVAFQAFSAVTSGITNEFKRGLKAVEDFDLAVATSAAFIATFSKNLKGTDIAGVYDRAAGYAGRLNEKLEMIDTQTIASGKHLQTMSETFIQHGVLLDINNQKQVEGFTNIATALAMVTAGQNQDVQVRQEINALMLGQVRATDRLAQLLMNIDPQLKSHLKTWREEGTVIENVGELLKGFASNTGTLQNQWVTVGSTMETIHNRILRDAFRPMFEDLIKLAKALNSSLMDSEGNLTYIAIGIQNIIKGIYEFSKVAAKASVDAGKQMVAGLPVVGPIVNALGLMEKLNGELAKTPDINFGIIDSLKAEAAELARLRNMEDPWMHNALVAPELKPHTGKEYESKASDLNAALQAEVELIKAAEENKLAVIRTYSDQMQQLNQNDYDLGLSSYSDYLEEKNALTQRSLAAELAAKETELAAARDAAAKLSPITDKEGNARPDKDAKAHADALKKVEDAERGVTEAANKLTQAQVEGSHAAQVANKELTDSYHELQAELLEMTGRHVEAAQLMLKYDDEAVAKQHLSVEEQRVADIKRQIAQQKITELKRQDLATTKEAALALAEIDGQYYKSLDLQTELLDIEMQRTDLLPAQIELLKKQREEIERMKDPMDAWAKGWEDVVEHQKTSSELMYDLARTTAQDMQQAFSDTFFNVMKGNFEDIGDVWSNLLDRMLDNFLRMIADMIAAWAASELFEMFTGTESGFTFAGALSGKSGGTGGAVAGIVGELGKEYISQGIKESVAAYFTSSAATAASTSTNLAQGTATPAILDAAANSGSGYSSLLGTAGGVIGVAGGGYGMYSGVQNISKGNYAVGSVQTGLGAYSTYQGAVTLGLIEKGTATAAYDAVASYFATEAAGTATTTAAATTAGTSTGATAGLGAGATLGIGAALMAAVAMIGLNQMANNVPTRNSLGHTDPSQLGGIGLNGGLSNISKEQVAIADELGMKIKQFGAASIDTANGVMVATTALAGPRGFAEGTEFALNTWDESTQTWYKGVKDNRHIWDDMLTEMSALKPASEAATIANAQLIASQHGLATVADELVIAYNAGAGSARFMADAQVQLTALMEAGVITINETSGAWEAQTGLYSDMVDEMKRVAPVTESAIQSTAEYIATAHGVPQMADELAAAFALLSGGLSGLGGAAGGAVSSIYSALASLQNPYLSGGRDNAQDIRAYIDSNGKAPYTPEGYTPTEYMVGTSDPKKKYTYATYDGAMADGGDIGPGRWGMVGEAGPEIIWGPAHVTSTKDTGSLMQSNKEMLSAIFIMGRNIARMSEEIQTINNLGIKQRDS